MVCIIFSCFLKFSRWINIDPFVFTVVCVIFHCTNIPHLLSRAALPWTVLYMSPNVHVQEPKIYTVEVKLMSCKEWFHLTLLSYIKCMPKFILQPEVLPQFWNVQPLCNWILFLFFLLFLSGTLFTHMLDFSNISSMYFNLFHIFLLYYYFSVSMGHILALSAHPLIISSVAYNLTFNHSLKI